MHGHRTRSLILILTLLLALRPGPIGAVAPPGTQLVPQQPALPETAQGTSLAAYGPAWVVFADGKEAGTTTWSVTEIKAVVPLDAVSGTVHAETQNGTSNVVSFTVGDSSVPDDSGEGTSWSTDVSGTIASDTTWSSNVRVTGDVEVSAGATLTIEPGVTVFFAAGSDHRSTGLWTDKAELHIHGTLIAEGTLASPIYLTSDAATKAIGDWGGIVIRRNSTDSSVVNAVLHYAESGIYLYAYEEGGGAISAEVTDCAIVSNTVGVHLAGCLGLPSGGTMTVDPVIAGNLIQGNSDYGIYFYVPVGYGTAKNDAVIQGNRVEGNGTGMRIHSNSWWLGHSEVYPQIRNNTIRNNAGYGIRVDAKGNEDDSGADTSVHPSIENNLLENNSTNIYLHFEAINPTGTVSMSPTIRYNTIRNASSGIVVDDTTSYHTLTATIWHNAFYGLSGYAVDNRTSRQVNASENYWGDTEAEWDAGAQGGDVNGNVITSSHLTSTSAPMLSCIVPASGQAGDRVTLYGANFSKTLYTAYCPLVYCGITVWYRFR